MITLLSNSSMGVCDWAVSTIEERDSLDIKNMSPSSTVKMINDEGMRFFILKADKSGWLEVI